MVLVRLWRYPLNYASKESFRVTALICQGPNCLLLVGREGVCVYRHLYATVDALVYVLKEGGTDVIV